MSSLSISGWLQNEKQTKHIQTKISETKIKNRKINYLFILFVYCLNEQFSRNVYFIKFKGNESWICTISVVKTYITEYINNQPEVQKPGAGCSKGD